LKSRPRSAISLALLTLWLLASATLAAPINDELVCKELKTALQGEGNLDTLRIKGVLVSELTTRFDSVDFDGDNVVDEATLSCSDSASAIPPDPCTFESQLSTGLHLSFSDDRLMAIRYKGQPYLIGIKIDPKSRMITRELFSIRKEGVHSMCTQQGKK